MNRYSVKLLILTLNGIWTHHLKHVNFSIRSFWIHSSVVSSPRHVFADNIVHILTSFFLVTNLFCTQNNARKTQNVYKCVYIVYIPVLCRRKSQYTFNLSIAFRNIRILYNDKWISGVIDDPDSRNSNKNLFSLDDQPVERGNLSVVYHFILDSIVNIWLVTWSHSVAFVFVIHIPRHR